MPVVVWHVESIQVCINISLCNISFYRAFIFSRVHFYHVFIFVMFSFLSCFHFCLELIFILFSFLSFSCTTGDFVKLFLNLEKGVTGVNEHSEWDQILCGHHLTNSEVTHFSIGPMLMFEFHTDSVNTNNTGFSGTYQFLNKSDFIPEGELLSGSQCDYQFVRLSMNDKISGKLYSPHYPSKYPRNARCAFHFFGKYNEKVKVLFESIQLQSDDVR